MRFPEDFDQSISIQSHDRPLSEIREMVNAAGDRVGVTIGMIEHIILRFGKPALFRKAMEGSLYVASPNLAWEMMRIIAVLDNWCVLTDEERIAKYPKIAAAKGMIYPKIARHTSPLHFRKDVTDEQKRPILARLNFEEILRFHSVSKVEAMAIADISAAEYGAFTSGSYTMDLSEIGRCEAATKRIAGTRGNPKSPYQPQIIQYPGSGFEGAIIRDVMEGT